MKLDLSALKTHLAHCANSPLVGRYFGLAFTKSCVPAIVMIEVA